MINILKKFFYALWYHNIEIFSNFGDLSTIIYILSFCILFLENGVIFAFFLPGDTLLIFLGVLIARDILNFPFTLGMLTVAASLGSWFSYLQGKWLEDTILTKYYFVYLPERYHILSNKIFHSYGLFALFIGRFIVFVRTILPIIVSLSKLNNMHFHFFNWLSAFFWVFALTFLGFILGKTEYIQRYEYTVIYYLIALFFFIVIIISIVRYVKKIFLWK